MSDKRAVRGEVSVLDWIGTLFLSAIPVVNLILWIVWVFVARRASKRNFAIAALTLTILFTLLSLVACALWGSQMVAFFQNLNASHA